MTTLARTALFLLLSLTLHAACAATEDGYDLWLRYRPLAPAAQAALGRDVSALSAPGLDGPSARAALAELERGLAGMLGRAPARWCWPRRARCRLSPRSAFRWPRSAPKATCCAT